MMKKRYSNILRTSLVTSAVLICAHAHAESAEQSSQSLYLGAGSFGIGIGYQQRLSEAWAGRILLNTGLQGKQKDKNISDVHYDIKVKLGTGLTLLADYYPISGSGFRISGGLNVSSTKADLKGRNDGSGYNINGHHYSNAQVGDLNSSLKFSSVKPYLGVGWESKALGEKGWRFVSDLGVMYSGKSKGSLNASGAANNAALRQDLDAESKDLNKRSLGVVVGLGAAYAF